MKYFDFSSATSDVAT